MLGYERRLGRLTWKFQLNVATYATSITSSSPATAPTPTPWRYHQGRTSSARFPLPQSAQDRAHDQRAFLSIELVGSVGTLFLRGTARRGRRALPASAYPAAGPTVVGLAVLGRPPLPSNHPTDSPNVERLSHANEKPAVAITPYAASPWSGHLSRCRTAGPRERRRTRPTAARARRASPQDPAGHRG